MKKAPVFLVLAVALAMPGMAGAVERPGEPVGVPFEWDPNLCPVPAFDWLVTEPNVASVYEFSVLNRFGGDVNSVSVTRVDAIVMDYAVERTGKRKVGDLWIQEFEVRWVPPVGEALHYLRIQVTDVFGRADARTLLVLCLGDDPPVIYPSDHPTLVPVSNAGKTWQDVRKLAAAQPALAARMAALEKVDPSLGRFIRRHLDSSDGFLRYVGPVAMRIR